LNPPKYARNNNTAHREGKSPQSYYVKNLSPVTAFFNGLEAVVLEMLKPQSLAVFQLASRMLRGECPLWVDSRRSDCHDFVSLSGSYRPIADIRQAQKNRTRRGFMNR
jgi:hypothetical protein